MGAARVTPAMLAALRTIEHGHAVIRRVDTGYALQKRGLAEPFKEEHAGYLGRVYTITPKGREALAKVTP